MPTPISGASPVAFGPAMAVKDCSLMCVLRVRVRVAYVRSAYCRQVNGTEYVIRNTKYVLLFLEGRVERDRRRREVELAQERGGFGGAVLAIHLAIFPLDR